MALQKSIPPSPIFLRSPVEFHRKSMDIEQVSKDTWEAPEPINDTEGKAVGLAMSGAAPNRMGKSFRWDSAANRLLQRTCDHSG